MQIIEPLLDLQLLFWFGWILSTTLFLLFISKCLLDVSLKKKSLASMGPVAELPEGFSAQQVVELVIRLLRGEPIEAVSRESRIPALELERWQRIFVEQGARGLLAHGEAEDRELLLARAKIGELLMRLELAEELINKSGLTDEWKRGT